MNGMIEVINKVDGGRFFYIPAQNIVCMMIFDDAVQISLPATDVQGDKQSRSDFVLALNDKIENILSSLKSGGTWTTTEA